MKFLKYFLLVFLIQFVAISFAQQFPPRPNPPQLVNDKLDLLTQDQKQALEQKLVEFDKKTSTQIAIVTTDDIQGMDVGDYTVGLGKKWGVGNSNFDNGVVFLIFRSKDNNNRKVFIATGNGLEGVLPDYTCSEIVNNEVIPYLKGGDFYRALDNGTTAIINATEGKYTAPEGYGELKAPSLLKILFIIFIIIIVLSIISKGGGGGTYMSRRGHRGFTGPVIWWGGGGSGGGGGGFSGGGGFGGFGGGGFGGGGAGGSW